MTGAGRHKVTQSSQLSDAFSSRGNLCNFVGGEVGTGRNQPRSLALYGVVWLFFLGGG